MRIITPIFVIFLAGCAYSKVIDGNQTNLPNTIEEIESEIGNKVENLNDKVKDTVEKVIPPCFFGVKSVSMVLFTSDIPYGKVIMANESYNNIDPTKPIAFLVHGFISDANTTASYMLASELVKNNYTVFSLDWSEGACTTGLPIIKFTGYPSAVANTREIGIFMASYVTSLIESGFSLKNITFLGHSLGAHVCGFAAKKIQQSGYGTVPHLFAADPAAPLFFSNSCSQRVCNEDAERVFVFHTSELGIPQAIGDVDFYMHYGLLQPGCNINIVCSHTRAVEYLANMLKDNCGFPGVSVSTLDILLKRKPDYPGPDTTNCILATKKLFENSDIENGKYYTFVESSSPFCTNQSFKCQQ